MFVYGHIHVFDERQKRHACQQKMETTGHVRGAQNPGIHSFIPNKN